MNFSLTMDARPPDALIKASGELDVFTTMQLSDRLQDALEIGCLRVLMNLEDVTFVDASALHVLDRYRRRLAEIDGRMHIVTWSPPFLRLCRITGLDRTFSLDLAEPEPA